MSDKFRSVAPLMNGWLQALNASDDPQSWHVNLFFGDDHFTLSVAEAKALHEWLGRALPCEHLRTFTGYVKVDPFGKSDATRKIENQCLDCGHPYFTNSGEVGK